MNWIAQPLTALMAWLHRASTPYPGSLNGREELAAMRAQFEWRATR